MGSKAEGTAEAEGKAAGDPCPPMEESGEQHRGRVNDGNARADRRTSEGADSSDKSYKKIVFSEK